MTTATEPEAVPADAPRGAPRWMDAVAGVLAAAVALGVSELLHGVVRSAPSLVAAVGDTVIDNAPKWLVDTGIDTFGTADKPALVIGTVLICLVVGAAIGIGGRRHPAVPVVVFAAFALVGALAGARDPLASTGWAVVSAALAGVVGWLSLRWLHRAADGRVAPIVTTLTEGPDTLAPVTAVPGSRREFLARAGVVAAVATVTPLAGRRLRDRFAVEAARADIRVGGGPPTASGLSVPGVSPLYTPNDDFYRIDTALVVPQVEPSSWRMRITGEVENEIELDLDALIARAVDDVDVTLCCVSNEVGGDLIGNARWSGVPLTELLDEARPTAGAEQVVGVSVDGFTAGFPLELAYDGRPAIVAVGMNGEPLPVAHGFPARLVVSGLYGYVSATKWLSEIRLTAWDDVDGYWIPRGWSKEGPIKTGSRIDVPRSGSTVDAGEVAVAGVAWAQGRGIRAVEVSVDDGPWTEADLGDDLSDDTWRQWFLPWSATPGSHTIAVRATDGDGEVQTAERRPVAPDGATGHHTVRVEVR